MKLIDLNGVKVLFDVLMERIGVEIYTKAEADNKFQPKGKYVEEEYLQQLETAWSDELDKKADKGEVENALSTKADLKNVYNKQETEALVANETADIKANTYTKAEVDEKIGNRIPLEEYLLYPNIPTSLEFPDISVLRVEIVGTGIVEFCEVQGNIDATHEFNTVGNMGGGLPHIWLAVDGEEFAIAGPNGSGPLTFSRDFEYIGRIKISWGGDIETCKNRKNHSIILREHDK
nr:MAG TPA: MukB N-terminal [Caudoviricetes sp.]